ncbi:hypothetical protein [Micromonospora viridifaciens]|uniref:hypothetical protein n=1 Tax=Micromonospora viridifaciens TaxID=1881 RepID=UPI0012FE11DF|nr:hypothetical protein [Micromonospora viridifaciens]
MNVVLRELLERGGGVVTRTAVEPVVPEWVLQRACGNGELVRVLPEVFVAAHLLDDRRPGIRRETLAILASRRVSVGVPELPSGRWNAADCAA